MEWCSVVDEARVSGWEGNCCSNRGGGNGQTLPYPTTTNLFQKKALFLENFPSFQTIFFVKEFMLLGGGGKKKSLRGEVKENYV